MYDDYGWGGYTPSYNNPEYPAAPAYGNRQRQRPQAVATFFVDGDIGAQSIPLENGQSCFAIDKKREIFYFRSLSNGEFEGHKYKLVEIFDTPQQSPDFAAQIQQLRDEITKTNQRIDSIGKDGANNE